MQKTALTIMALGLIILLMGSVALGQKIANRYWLPADPPRWTPIPDLPGVEYAPNIGQDLFRYRGCFYNFFNGAWLRASEPRGPWVEVRELPWAFYNIQAPYFKVPPGWAKGRKAGWGSSPMPPGQMKKFNRGPVHPGRAKKKGGWHKY